MTKVSYDIAPLIYQNSYFTMNAIQDMLRRILPFILYVSFNQFIVDYNAWDEYLKKSHKAKCRRNKRRITWSSVNERISDTQFRRMFRMSRECFSLLCGYVIASKGEKAFKSESYIHAFLETKNPMYMAYEKTSGGFISGETKLAITL